MEGFQFAIALNLNMGYYTIQLSPKSKDLTTIVTEFGKFRYNVLPIVKASRPISMISYYSQPRKDRSKNISNNFAHASKDLGMQASRSTLTNAASG